MSLDPAEVSLLQAAAEATDAGTRAGTNEVAVRAIALLGPAVVAERDLVLLPPWQGLDSEAQTLVRERLLQLHQPAPEPVDPGWPAARTTPAPWVTITDAGRKALAANTTA